jgi:hypothetical protein
MHVCTSCRYWLHCLPPRLADAWWPWRKAPWKHASVHWEYACLAAQTALLGFSLYLKSVAHKEPWETWQRRSPSQSGGEVRSHRTRGSAGAHLSREASFGAIGHVAAPEPTSVGRWGPEPYDTWQHRSPPQPSHRTRDSVGAHLSWEAKSGAIWHMTAPEPTSTGWQGPEL